MSWYLLNYGTPIKRPHAAWQAVFFHSSFPESELEPREWHNWYQKKTIDVRIPSTYGIELILVSLAWKLEVWMFFLRHPGAYSTVFLREGHDFCGLSGNFWRFINASYRWWETNYVNLVPSKGLCIRTRAWKRENSENGARNKWMENGPSVRPLSGHWQSSYCIGTWASSTSSSFRRDRISEVIKNSLPVRIWGQRRTKVCGKS